MGGTSRSRHQLISRLSHGTSNGDHLKLPSGKQQPWLWALLTWWSDCNTWECTYSLIPHVGTTTSQTKSWRRMSGTLSFRANSLPAFIIYQLSLEWPGVPGCSGYQVGSLMCLLVSILVMAKIDGTVLHTLYFFWQGLRRRSKQRRKLMHTKKAGGIEETTWDNSACATPMSTMIFFSVLTAGKLERDWYMASGWMTTQSYSIYVSETESCQTNQTINNQFIKQFTTQTDRTINKFLNPLLVQSSAGHGHGPRPKKVELHKEWTT